MNDPYGKGSIIYKVLIVVLLAALVVSIVYPKKLWDAEAARRDLCRFRMSNIYNAELQFQRFNAVYTDTLDRLLDFVKHDPRYLHLVDSTVVRPIHHARTLLDTLRQIQLTADKLVVMATDSVIKDSVAVLQDLAIGRSRDLRDLMEYIRERMITYPALPVPTYDKGLEIIERKDYFLKFEVVRRMVVEVGDLRVARISCRESLANIDSISQFLRLTLDEFANVPQQLDSLRYCPTVNRPYTLALQDSGVFKFVNIFCPINEDDIKAVRSDFVRSKVGSLKLQNHGSIIKHQMSWEQES